MLDSEQSLSTQAWGSSNMRNTRQLLLNQLKSFALILLVGAWGGSVLHHLIGVSPQNSIAYASSAATEPLPAIVDIDYRLDPDNPAFLLSLEIEVASPNAQYAPGRLMVNVAGPDQEWQSCFTAKPNTLWHCPLSGTLLRDVNRLEYAYR